MKRIPNKMLDDIIFKHGDSETIKAYLEYCEKIDSRPRTPFIICSAEFANVLNEIKQKTPNAI
jgi:hypothetical protein